VFDFSDAIVKKELEEEHGTRQTLTEVLAQMEMLSLAEQLEQLMTLVLLCRKRSHHKTDPPGRDNVGLLSWSPYTVFLVLARVHPPL
jgi:hypothetical protein